MGASGASSDCAGNSWAAAISGALDGEGAATEVACCRTIAVFQGERHQSQAAIPAKAMQATSVIRNARRYGLAAYWCVISSGPLAGILLSVILSVPRVRVWS